MSPPPRRKPRPALSARAVALQVLLDCRMHNAFVQELLDQHFHAHPLSPADRRLTTQMVYGVLRRRGTLDALLQPLLRRDLDQVEIWLWEALRLGAYQLILLSNIPPHAALNETVELATLLDRPSAKGFLNGVLRSLSRLVVDERTTEPAADAVPLEEGGYRRLKQPVFADPVTQPLDYLASAYSLPRWLLDRWSSRYSIEECRRLGAWFLHPAPLWLRVNPLRSNREQCLAQLRERGMHPEPGDHPQAICLRETVPLRDVPGFSEGCLTVQDESAMRVASALNPTPRSSVLDLCAAPGGKTTHLAELMGNQGRILACDVDERRLRLVEEGALRLGLTNIQTRRLNPNKRGRIEGGPFDAVLIDVPCSNTGVLGRRPEVRWRLKPVDLRHLVQLQSQLLRQGYENVRAGGTIIYSTCSIEPEENQGVVQGFVEQTPGVSIEAMQEGCPGLPADGSFWARLRVEKSSG